MNTSKADYAFLEPTWKLPSSGTPASQTGMYDRPYSSSGQKLDPDMSTWTNTMPNTRYIPPNTNHGSYPQTTNQQRENQFMQSGPPQLSQQQEQYFTQSGSPALPSPSYQQQGQRFMQSGPPAPIQPLFQQLGQSSIRPAMPQSFRPQEQPFLQSGLLPSPSPSYQQQGQRFMQPGSVQSFQPQGERPMQSGPPAPTQLPFQQFGQSFMQPALPQSFRPQEQLFLQSGLLPSPSPSHQQQGQRPVQSGPLKPPGLFNQQPAPPQSFRPQEELFMRSGPFVLPLPRPLYQPPWQRSLQPDDSQSLQPQEQFVMQSRPPVPAVRSSQQSNIQYQNDENSNDDYGFFTNTKSNDGYNDMAAQPIRNGYSNEQNMTRGFNYPLHPEPLEKRVQMNTHNQQTFSSDHGSSRESPKSYSSNNHPSELNRLEQKSKPLGNQIKDTKLGSSPTNGHRPNNFKIHEYLYGLSAPDSGSYVSAYKNQRRRLQDERVNHKSVISEYKSFLQNGGFGPVFGSNTQQTYEEKVDAENKRKAYSKLVRDVNQHNLEEQKRIQNNMRQERTRTHISPPLRRRRPEELSSHYLFTPEVKEFERKLKLEHDANCKCSLHAKPFDSFA